MKCSRLDYEWKALSNAKINVWTQESGQKRKNKKAKSSEGRGE